MPENKVWATSEDGSLEYISLTENLVQPAIKALQQSFYLNESICMAVDMPNQPESFPEMDFLLLRAAKDGVSVVARDKITGKIAGAAFNKLEEDGKSATFYEDYVKACKHSASRGVTQWMLDLENMFNIFDYCKVKNCLEVMFVGTVPEFRKRGIAKKLFEVSIDVAKSLKQGQYVNVPINNQTFQLENPPEIVTAICTSFITQKIAKDFNFKTAVQIEFNKFNSNGKSFGVIVKGKLKYVSVTKDTLNELIGIMKTYFFTNENICTALGFAQNPQAIDELEDFMIKAAQHGVSLLAIDKETGKTVGAMLNKIQHKDTSSKSAYEEYIKRAKYQETKAIFEFLSQFEDSVDPFTPYNADCLLELLFLVVSPEYARRGIGLKLCELSIELAKELLKGNNVKTSIDNTLLPLNPRPQVVTALFTTFKTQKMARKLNFTILKEVLYDNIYHNGKSYASIIGPGSKSFTIECLQL